MPTPDEGVRETLLDGIITDLRSDVPPDADVTDAVSRLQARVRTESATSDRGETEYEGLPAETSRLSFLRRHAMKISLAAAASIGLALLSTLTFRGGPVAGAAWADIVAQVRDAQTARLHMTIKREPGGTTPAEVRTVSIKVPDLMRTDQEKPLSRTTIQNGSDMVLLDPSQKVYRRQEAHPVSAGAIIAQLLGVAAPADAPGRTPPHDRTVEIEKQTVQLVHQATETRDGRRLHKYLINAPASSNTNAPGESKYAWFDAETEQFVLLTSEMTADGRTYEAAEIWVELNVDLPDELFSVDLPNGYTDVTQVIEKEKQSDRPQAFNKYLRARGIIDHYRLVAWIERDGNFFPIGRSARDRDRFRADSLMGIWQKHKATLFEEEVKAIRYDRRRPWDDPAALDAVWHVADNNLIHAASMALDGKPVTLKSPYPRSVLEGGRLKRIEGDEPIATRSPEPNSGRYLLSHLGRPLHYWTPSGEEPVVDGKPVHVYEMMPERSDRPGLVGVRVEKNPMHPKVQTRDLYIYWLDPSRDYLCVRHESYRYRDTPWHGKLDWQPVKPVSVKVPEQTAGPREEEEVTTIVEFGRTPKGRWYPTVLERQRYRIVDGKRYGPTSPRRTYIQADFISPVAEAILAWPEGVSKPDPRRRP